MRWGLNVSWTVVVLLSIVCLSIAAPCFADNDEDPRNPGDPVDEVPLCRMKPLEPTTGMFSDVWTVLMAMAFQLAL